MHRPVCVKCFIGMDRAETGVTVIEMAFNPPSPYKLWHADLWKCPVCGTEVVADFAEKPYAQHFEDGFEAKLVRAHSEVFVIEYETVAQAETLEPAGSNRLEPEE